MNRQRLTLFFIFLTDFVSGSIFEHAVTAAPRCPSKAPFVFREGDTLSEVLWFLGSEPVYGKRGWIEKTWAINPHLKKYRGKDIPPGTRVLIPLKECPPLGGWTIENGELVAPYHHPQRKTPDSAPKANAPENQSKNTSIPSATPTQNPTPKPAATPKATQVPTPEPTSTPMPEPTSVPTPEPTSAPTPAATSVPDAAPQPKAKPILLQKPSENLQKNFKNSREVFDKTKQKEREFIKNLKNSDDFQIK